MIVSVVTPTYNDSRYLKENIESVLRQSYENVEHIVIDGDSSDGTVDILKSYSQIKWISESDDGMYEAVNKGIQMASGNVVGYLNADDRYFSYTLELVCNYFKENLDVDFVYGYCTYVDTNERPICTFRAAPFMPRLLTRARIPWAQPTCFWRRSVHEKVGYFDETMKCAGDGDFFRRMLACGLKGKLIRKPLVKFMARDDCLSKTMAPTIEREIYEIAKRYSLRKGNGLYLCNEIIHYLLNIDSFFLYMKSKSNKSKEGN